VAKEDNEDYMAAEIIIQVVILNKMKRILILFYVKGRLPGTRN
jgi:hypothetical protein